MRGLVVGTLVLALVGFVVFIAGSSALTEDAVRAMWRRSDLKLFALAFAMMTAGLYFLALRWRAMMTDRTGVEVLPLTGVFVVGTLLHYALPGPVGEFAAAALAGRRFRISTEMAFAASVHARFIGLAVAGFVSAALFATLDMPVPDGMSRWIGLATAAIAGGAVALGVLSAYPAVLREASARTIGRIRFLRRVHASVERLADSLQAVGRLGPRRYAWGVLWALCGHGAVAGGIWMAAYALGATPDPAGLAFTYTMSTAGAVVLFAFPGSQLGWDAMFASLLVATAGLAVPDALAVTLLVRLQQLFIVLLGGILLLRVAAVRTDDTGPLIG
ncbi:MAG: lysylphosphatidylglycerol synthase transmembrane domain-containing protein [Pseudomonadota bacterium]|nr:lysylphosphatidylglycerol synthase transmembrane domain-containing protein [Pseudomonadota bacterium]